MFSEEAFQKMCLILEQEKQEEEQDCKELSLGYKKLPVVLASLVKGFYKELPNFCAVCETYKIQDARDYCEDCDDELDCKCGARLGLYEYFSLGQCINCEEGHQKPY